MPESHKIMHHVSFLSLLKIANHDYLNRSIEYESQLFLR
jgi:hypothetical protein